MTRASHTVVFLGDSITAAADGYVTLVTDELQARGHRIQSINAGVPGDRSIDLLPRLERTVLAAHPTIVTLAIGVNDLWRGLDAPSQGLLVELDDYVRAVETVLDRVTVSGTQAVVLTTSVIGEWPESEGNRRLAPYNAALRRLASARDLPLADVNAAFHSALTLPHPPALTIDGIHLTAEGHRLMARPILETLHALLSRWPGL